MSILISVPFFINLFYLTKGTVTYIERLYKGAVFLIE